MLDVLIIGSGGAGLAAALSAKDSGANIKVLAKTYPTHSQTVQAQGGINAVLQDGEDSIRNHINDTYKSSRKLGNIDNIKLMCNEAKNSIEWLDKVGVPFTRNEEGNIAQRKFGGTKNSRTCYSSDYTGLKILHTLYDQCIKEDVEFLNEYILLNIIVENNIAKGVTALNINNTEVVEIFASSIILATGGYSNVYNNFTTNSNSTTGDGVAAAFRAGAILSNMEYIQFHPTAMKGNNILISESARAEGGYLVDSNGKRFVDELSTRDAVARAIHDKILEGQDVFLDLRHIGLDKINEIMPQERRLALEFLNVDISKELLAVNPAAHYSMGGIKTNVSCETSIKNLFACGECAQNDVHGANRLGGNSLLEIITFGRIAGKKASEESKKIDLIVNTSSKQFSIDKNKIDNIFNLPKEINFYDEKIDLGKSFFKDVGLYRNEESLKNVTEKIKIWKKNLPLLGLGDKSRIYNKNLIEYIEYENMLQLSELILLSAISRKESRGAHYRIDYPNELEEYEKNSISYIKEDILTVEFEVKNDN